jgi:Histidine kinase-, DNA gyrase B-, and HSP90-like ATPase
MKNIFAVFFLFSLNSFAQKQEVFKIDSLSKQGVLLDKGWKWLAWDNPDFAKADFDDSAWESIEPMKDIMDLPQIWKTEIVWFRLRFNADSSLVNKSLVMQVNQTGASEIFLNGQFIGKFGEIDTKAHQIQASTPIYGSFIGLPKYQPIVIISTQQADSQVIIKISDNGTGMSEATKAKIFQPFFTTKPTGQGTGLGLSLAYDIITKGYGGTIDVETKEGEGTTFIINLPI